MYDYPQWNLSQAHSDGLGSAMSNNTSYNGTSWYHASAPLPSARSGPTCQVEGCQADLSLEEKAYCTKKRICSEHMRAECIVRPGDDQQLWRFCFQCGKLEPLSQFDGPKRSCRSRLERRKLPPRRSMTWSAGSRPHAPTSSNSTGTQPQQQQQQQQQVTLLQEIQQQQALLDNLNQQMLMQQQLQQQQQQLLQATTSLQSSPAPSGLVSASPETMALLQQQQMLLEQKRMQLQALKAAMSQGGGGSGGGQCGSHMSPAASGPTTPSMVPPGRISLDGYNASLTPSQMSPATAVCPLSQTGGAATFSHHLNGGHAACGPLQASLGTTSSAGFFSQSSAEQQIQIMAATAGPTVVPSAAAAAAALAGSNNWPFLGGAAGVGDVTVARGSSGGSQQLSAAGDANPAAMEMCDEFDPLTAEFAAAFPELDLCAPIEAQQAMTPDHLSASIEAAVAAVAARPATSTLSDSQELPIGVPHGMQLPAQQMSSGHLPYGAPTTTTTSTTNTTTTSQQQQFGGCGMQQMMGHQLAPMSPGAGDASQLQLQALMQSVQSLHESVRELSLRVGGGGQGSTPSASVGPGMSADSRPSM